MKMFCPVAITLVATLLNSITPLAQTKPTRAPSATAADEQQPKAIDDAWGEAESKRDRRHSTQSSMGASSWSTSPARSRLADGVHRGRRFTFTAMTITHDRIEIHVIRRS